MMVELSLWVRNPYPLYCSMHCLMLLIGAIDANVVKNLSAIEWHKVMPFSPFNNENATITYLQWAVRLPGVGVRFICVSYVGNSD